MPEAEAEAAAEAAATSGGSSNASPSSFVTPPPARRAATRPPAEKVKRNKHRTGCNEQFGVVCTYVVCINNVREQLGTVGDMTQDNTPLN